MRWFFNGSVLFSKADLSTLLTEQKACGIQISLMPEACDDSHWPQPSGVPHSRGRTSAADRRVQNRGQLWAVVSEEEEGAGHPPTHLTMFYYLFVLCFKGGCKLETGAWTAVLTERDSDRERLHSWPLNEWEPGVAVAAWPGRGGGLEARCQSPFRRLFPKPCWLILACRQFFSHSLHVCWGNMRPSTCEPGEGSRRNKGRAWFPSLSFPLTSGSWTSHQQKSGNARKWKQ